MLRTRFEVGIEWQKLTSHGTECCSVSPLRYKLRCLHLLYSESMDSKGLRRHGDSDMGTEGGHHQRNSGAIQSTCVNGGQKQQQSFTRKGQWQPSFFIMVVTPAHLQIRHEKAVCELLQVPSPQSWIATWKGYFKSAIEHEAAWLTGGWGNVSHDRPAALRFAYRKNHVKYDKCTCIMFLTSLHPNPLVSWLFLWQKIRRWCYQVVYSPSCRYTAIRPLLRM